jgi:hypothetical protein
MMAHPGIPPIHDTRKVFGIGWAKTGTTTLGVCLKRLGFRHQGQDLSLVHDLQRGDLSRILDIATRHQVFEDWPWLLLFRELDTHFPGSRFILTTRDPERWLQSYRNMLRGQGLASEGMNEIRSILYGLPFPDVTDGQLLDRYRRHQREVLAYFDGRSSDLLVVDWEAGDGWPQLCGFLGMDIPDRPFPHANRGRYPDR